MEVRQLKDNRWLGCSTFEIVTLPVSKGGDAPDLEYLAKHSKAFMQMSSEFYTLTGGRENYVLEYIWITEPTDNQAFISRLRLFAAIRYIGASKAEVEALLGSIIKSLFGSLESRQYGLEPREPSEISSILPARQGAFAVVKREMLSVNPSLPFPYYSCGIIPNNSEDNFESLVSLMSRHENCALSFQLIPTRFSRQEEYFLHELDVNCGQLVSGVFSGGQTIQDPAAAEPYRFYSYYCGKLQAPIFKYNILVIGTSNICSELSAKVISLLQSGRDVVGQANFGAVDLARESLNLNRDFLLYPWNVNNRLIHAYRNKSMLSRFPVVNALKRMPYIVSADEAAVFMRFPIYERGMAALKANQQGMQAEQFDKVVTQETNIQLGTFISGGARAPVIGCPVDIFTKHALIVGVPGSGKTTLAFNVLLQFHRKHIPFLAVEPTKSEYRGMLDSVPEMQVFTPGNSSVSPFILNPFIPPTGISVEQYIPGLTSAFRAAFAMPSPLDVIFLRAIRECYTKYGWKDYSKATDSDVTVFGLFEFILTFKNLIANSKYSGEIKGNLESGGVFRLMNLIEQNRAIFDTVNTIPIEDLICKPTVIELNAIENAEQKALIMALLLINICGYIKANRGSDSILKNIILIDEAHVLLGESSRTSSGGDNPDPRAAAVKAIQDMIAEIRAYGTGIIIADQSPAKVSREIVAQTEIKVAFRLVQSLDRDLIADTTNMDEETSRQLSRLQPGEAYAYYSKLDTAIPIMTPDIRARAGIRLNVPDSDIRSRMTYWSTHKLLLRPYNECKFCSDCVAGCDNKIRADAGYYAKRISSEGEIRIKSDKDLIIWARSLGKLLSRLMKVEHSEVNERLIKCTAIQFCREMRLNTPYRILPIQLRNIIFNIRAPE